MRIPQKELKRVLMKASMKDVIVAGYGFSDAFGGKFHNASGDGEEIHFNFEDGNIGLVVKDEFGKLDEIRGHPDFLDASPAGGRDGVPLHKCRLKYPDKVAKHFRDMGDPLRMMQAMYMVLMSRETNGEPRPQR